MRCVILASTGGSVMSVLLRNDYFRERVFAVVTDRECGAMETARRVGIPCRMIPERSQGRFCDLLLGYLRENHVDYVISFFTRLLGGQLLEHYRDRIINLHPSLLPAFRGMDGFGDTLGAGVRYVGSTIHFIDEHMDRGRIILQTVYPLDPDGPVDELRHRIFEQQCKSLLQVIRWLDEERVHVQDGLVKVRNASFRDLEYSPGLDFDEALALCVPFGGKSPQ